MAYNALHDDTIAAIATPFGRAGIGIVRMSGPRAGEIAQKIFRPNRAFQKFESHRLYLGRLTDPSTGRMIDEVLLSLMKAPHSYTGEDVIEINSHSGPLLLSRILQILLNEGARLAQPGEFTFRAFLSGRIDLTQAESVVDLVNAKSEKGLELASRQIRGELRTKIEDIRYKIIDVLALAEVAIDYPEEEVEILDRVKTAALIEDEIMKPVKRIIAAHGRRKIWMEGVKTVIAGRVNAGKSSLLNRLLNEQRAIVTPVPGTTRDVIESTIYIEGLPFLLMDTAGIRKVRGKIEEKGIQLSEQKLVESDLALVLIDQSRPLNEDDIRILKKAPRDCSLIVVNKIDLPSRVDGKALMRSANGLPVTRISALLGEGIDTLCGLMREKVMKGDLDNDSSSPVPNQRQKTALLEVSGFLKVALNNIREDASMEIIAVDLRSALDSLAVITGETGNEEIYDRIFREFCLGK